MTLVTQLAVEFSVNALRSIQVVQTEVIVDDETGVEVARRHPHCHVVVPGDDLTDQHPDVQAMAAVLWTPQVLASFQAGIKQPAATPVEVKE